MQYEVGLKGYNNEEKVQNRISIKYEIISFIILFVTSMMVSRVIVILNRNNIKGLAPFGIAFFLSIVSIKNLKKINISMIGTIVGYLTIINSLTEHYAYLVCIAVIYLCSIVSIKTNKRIKDIYMFLIVFLSYFIYTTIFSQFDFSVNLTLSLVNTIIIMPVYCVIKYANRCIDDMNTDYLFSVEELVSVGILIALVISGVGQITICNLNIRNIFLYLAIFMIAYVGGSTYGATMGIILGIVTGMSFGDIITGISFCGLIGLVIGLFKDTGKLFSIITVCIVFIGLSSYNGTISVIAISELLISATLFMLMPKKVLKEIEININSEVKLYKINSNLLNEYKSDVYEKVSNMTGTLDRVSSILENVEDNQPLMMKNKSTALIDVLADRVCTKCERCSRCWEQEFSMTYPAFEKMIRSVEREKIIFPHELEKKCLEKFDLIKYADRIVSNMKGDEAIRERMEQSRFMIANYIKSVSNSLDKMYTDFKKEAVINNDLQKVITKSLAKKDIEYKSLMCYTDCNGRSKIKITMDSCGGSQICNKAIVPIINELLSRPMCIGQESCKIDPKSNECSVVLEEVAKYSVISYGGMMAKSGEDSIGDTYSFNKTKGGNYITIISDGMGSGPEAGKESSATVELVEKFMESGFDINTTVNMINSVMGIKFEENEKFATLDLNYIDAYEGKASFVKIGAATSFILRGKKIISIESNLPPFGLVDELEIEPTEIALKNGDIIISLSDGILDINKDKIGDFRWLESVLIDAPRNPKEMVSYILEKAKDVSGRIIKDDMTVVVSRVSSNLNTKIVGN